MLTYTNLFDHLSRGIPRRFISTSAPIIAIVRLLLPSIAAGRGAGPLGRRALPALLGTRPLPGGGLDGEVLTRGPGGPRGRRRSPPAAPRGPPAAAGVVLRPPDRHPHRRADLVDHDDGWQACDDGATLTPNLG